MAAVTAVLFSTLRSGDVLVACGDGYPGIRGLAEERLAPLGVQTRLVASETAAIAEAADGAALVWFETPSNPRLDVVDIAAVAEAAHAAGALVAVDNTVCTPLGQQPLAFGADFAMLSGTKSLCGHSDVLLGAVSVAGPERAEALRRWRTQSGAIAGGFEAWLAHRSLATLGMRLERSSANAAAVAALLRARDDVTEVVPPVRRVAARQMAFAGPLVGFSLGSRRARAALPRRVRAGRRGHQLRRRALDRRAPRALGHRRRRRGLHPLLRGLRGRGGPARRRGPRARRHGVAPANVNGGWVGR